MRIKSGVVAAYVAVMLVGASGASPAMAEGQALWDWNPPKEFRAQMKFLIAAPLGTTMECAGAHFVKDPVPLTPVKCFRGDEQRQLNPRSISELEMNGWKVVSREFLPGEVKSYPMLVVKVKKVRKVKVFKVGAGNWFPGPL